MDPVTKYVNGWNAHDAAAIVSAFTKEGTYVDPMLPSPLSGEAIGQYAAGLWGAFPDLVFDVQLHRAGDRLATMEWVMAGTHREPLGTLAATGKRVSLRGVDVIRYDTAGIVSVEGYFDSVSLLRQLGVAPA